ncbi:hypothetical protein L914_00204 [Phytophthora nicotianae]|uniref:Uncharacterized protein n=3 Tax=Phytophthora nicotianae TaxID=4792 RepID=V9G2N7_PHYNI|nr:hypothetical protein F443_00232 [Phytophthora nicotianae P1569]ETM56887.1 hypothetical protein L914_00204 [Phytophthora nicotianae]ETO86201.1 hypothetical protein F444_00227 [Phytophthora nicotianae P1976]
MGTLLSSKQSLVKHTNFDRRFAGGRVSFVYMRIEGLLTVDVCWKRSTGTKTSLVACCSFDYLDGQGIHGTISVVANTMGEEPLPGKSNNSNHLLLL